LISKIKFIQSNSSCSYLLQKKREVSA